MLAVDDGSAAVVAFSAQGRSIVLSFARIVGNCRTALRGLPITLIGEIITVVGHDRAELTRDTVPIV